MSTTVDISGFERTMLQLKSVVQQDTQTFVRDEAARLGEECANQLARRGKSNHNSLRKDVASVFMPEPREVFSGNKSNGAVLNWLYATPYDLYGVKPSQDHRMDSVEDMNSVYRSALQSPPAEKIETLGFRRTSVRVNKHGHEISRQSVKRFTRMVVKRRVYERFVKMLISHFGRLEASFADTARKLKGTAKVSKRVSRHFPSEKNITIDSTSDVTAPSVEMGSRAVGILQFKPIIENAIRVRMEKMKLRMGHIISGYSRSKKRGQITPQAQEQVVIE
jgi:hypothetical protein